jgi:hypothetical protein
MFTQRSDCSNCGHSVVCSYKGRYHNFSNDVQKAAERGGLVEDKDAFFAMVDCRQWIPVTRNQTKTNMIESA